MNDRLKKFWGTRSQPTQQGTLLDLTDDSSKEIFNALSSETTRRIYRYLQNETATASEIASQTGTSIQNTQYHLEKLTEVELIEVIDTEYSMKGSEMQIYAATDDPLIIVSGSKTRREKVRSHLSNLLGGIGFLAVSSLFLEWLAQRKLLKISPIFGKGIELVSATNTPTGSTTLFRLSPGLVFFAGGLAVLLGLSIFKLIDINKL